MSSYNLGFISDDDIFHHVEETIKKYRFTISLEKFNHNLIDPIKLSFDSKIYKTSFQDLIKAEVNRQIDKSNTNHIGYFHQNIFKYFGNGWEVPLIGYDVMNQEKNIFVEIKNKHNTMNSSSSQKTYMRMQNTLIQNQQAQCYLVEVIAKNSQNIPWKISLDGISTFSNNIRRVSMDKFYELVTNEKFSFMRLCSVLPTIISDVLYDIESELVKNTVFEELKELSPNLMKSIFMLSFSKYDGFNEFEFRSNNE